MTQWRDRPCYRPAVLPAPLFAPTPKAAKRVLEFFPAQNQQRPHAQILSERHAAFCRMRCDAHGLQGNLSYVEPFHVAAFITVRADS